MTTVPAVPARERTRAPVQRPGVVGTTTAPADGIPKVKGEFEYSSDMRMEGMLWGATLRSTHPRADIWSLDISRALAIPGVRAVLTHEDVPGRKLYGMERADHPDVAEHVSRQVELLLVGGRRVVERGELRTADEAHVAAEIGRASHRLTARAEART